MYGLTQQQKQTIEAIAAMCPLEGGIAVYKARSLLNLYNDTIYFDDEVLCGAPSARIAQQEQKSKEPVGIKLYPNPNRGQFTVEFVKTGLRSVNLYNSLGQSVYSGRTSQTRLFLNLEHLRQGLYFLEAIEEETGQVHKEKVVYAK